MKIAQFKEEKSNLERKELALNISLVSLNMDIERERSMRRKLEGKEMMFSEEALEEEVLVLPADGDEDEQTDDVRNSDIEEKYEEVKEF